MVLTGIIFVFSTVEQEGGSIKEGTEPDKSSAESHTAEEPKHAGTLAGGGDIATALSSAGHTLEGPQVELVLNPLKLAFETKSLKILEPALDCLHVRN